MNKIQTKTTCPKCGTVIDFSDIKSAIKREILSKFDLELDEILEKL